MAPRRPAPIVLPNCPMDTLWEVDESSDTPSTQRFTSSEPLRSVFEDDDEVVFPLPPSTRPRRFFLPQMKLPIHSAPKPKQAPRLASPMPRPRHSSPKSSLTPPRPTRVPPPPPRVPSPVARPVSPSSSASSDNESPRTPPTTACHLPLPIPVLPPAEWESAIDELFALDDDLPKPKPVLASRPPRSTSRPTSRKASPPPQWTDEMSFVCMSPTGWSFDRPMTSPGFMPMSVSPPTQRWLSLAS